jgi:hypothetical protein
MNNDENFNNPFDLDFNKFTNEQNSYNNNYYYNNNVNSNNNNISMNDDFNLMGV